jgi:hypothetical protein
VVYSLTRPGRRLAIDVGWAGAETLTVQALDALIKDAVKSGTPIDGAVVLLNELIKAVRALNLELTPHLGCASGNPAGRGRVMPATATNTQDGYCRERPGRHQRTARSQGVVRARRLR